jgi:hypothetical protein
VIYGHGTQTISCNFCFPGSEEKTFTSSYMIDVCIEKARTPKPANYKLPSPKQRWKKYAGSKVPSYYTKGLYVLT